jgi:hypothetical protein
MVCPACSTDIPSRVFLSALGLKDMACANCGLALETTYESRLRFIGGGLVLAYLAAGLVRSLGLGEVLALGASAATFGAWAYFRAAGILSLRSGNPALPSLR